MLDMHTREHGYTEIAPPVLIKDTALKGTGQLPKFEADLFKTQKSEEGKKFDLYLSPTSEVQLTNIHSDEIVDEGRRSAGSRGREDRTSEGRDPKGRDAEGRDQGSGDEA